MRTSNDEWASGAPTPKPKPEGGGTQSDAPPKDPNDRGGKK